MRKIIELQMKIGETAIANIKFDHRSRDEITKLLLGLQAIYCNPEVCKQVFDVLIEIIPSDIDPKNGREGMDLWKIFVLGTLRLNCNWDYDKLHEIANNHDRLRQMLGHGKMDDDYEYALQTIRDNIALFTPEVLDKINQIVVKHGHEVAGKKKEEKLTGSCDSFVTKTDVHYPTDINLLFDAIRKMITLVMGLCGYMDISDWRQGEHHIRKAKKLYRKAQQLKRSSSKDKVKKAEREQLIIDAHNEYIDLAQSYIDRVRETLLSVQTTNIILRLRKILNRIY